MSVAIAGMGWVTPLGSGVEFVWKRLLNGHEALAERLSATGDDRPYLAYRVPESALANLPSNSRLRRVSAISRFAVAAGLEALANSNVKLDESNAERIALVFGISNGGVIYTRRFYSDIVESGAQAASPLLFPETVFNAPASHLAAVLGVTGATYTVVGDGAVGLLALRMGEDLMRNDELDYCLVIGAEEVDWLLCDAYRQWRLLRSQPPIEPYAQSPRGMILSEGAGAVLLGRHGRGHIKIDKTHAGADYRSRSELATVLRSVVGALSGVATDFVISSANGTFVDAAETQALLESAPDAITYSVKPALGESNGAVGLWQAIVAAQALQNGELPPLLHAPAGSSLRIAPSGIKSSTARSAIVLSCGLNQQIGAARLAKED